jgi:hypothetical protein
MRANTGTAIIRRPACPLAMRNDHSVSRGHSHAHRGPARMIMAGAVRLTRRVRVQPDSAGIRSSSQAPQHSQPMPRRARLVSCPGGCSPSGQMPRRSLRRGRYSTAPLRRRQASTTLTRPAFLERGSRQVTLPDVLVERRQQGYQSFHRERCNPIVTKCKDSPLCQSEHFRGLRLQELALT